MIHTQQYKVLDTRLVITLPGSFKNKRVIVTITDVPDKVQDKMALMKMGAVDPLFLADLKEVNDDFESIEHETL